MPRTKPVSTIKLASELILQLDELTTRLGGLSASGSHLKSTPLQQLEDVAERLRNVAMEFDPIALPSSVFDPAAPEIAGRNIALALMAQPRRPMAEMTEKPGFYGAGVYAIYYRGEKLPFPAYQALRGSDHPIYIGKADPESASATTPKMQGRAIWSRLREHANTIDKAECTLSIDDFECRFLVVQSGYQRAAEDYLIRFFGPIWNSETNICYGMSKHGDAAETRGNKRSPWHTIHPGVKWAANPKLVDQKPAAQITQDIAAHFKKYTPVRSIDEILKKFLQEMRQTKIAAPIDVPSAGTEPAAESQTFNSQVSA
jgi:hypothetical protein